MSNSLGRSGSRQALHTFLLLLTHNAISQTISCNFFGGWSCTLGYTGKQPAGLGHFWRWSRSCRFTTLRYTLWTRNVCKLQWNHCYFSKSKVKHKQKYLFTAHTVGKSHRYSCKDMNGKKCTHAHMLGPLRISLAMPPTWCSPDSPLARGFACLPQLWPQVSNNFPWH